MFDKVAEKIYGKVSRFIDIEGVSRRIKRLEVCTDGMAKDKCREFYCGIIKRVILAAGRSVHRCSGAVDKPSDGK